MERVGHVVITETPVCTFCRANPEGGQAYLVVVPVFEMAGGFYLGVEMQERIWMACVDCASVTEGSSKHRRAKLRRRQLVGFRALHDREPSEREKDRLEDALDCFCAPGREPLGVIEFGSSLR